LGCLPGDYLSNPLRWYGFVLPRHRGHRPGEGAWKDLEEK